jgi:hypothetical protein
VDERRAFAHAHGERIEIGGEHGQGVKKMVISGIIARRAAECPVWPQALVWFGQG